MEWLDEINAVAVTLGWFSLLWAYRAAWRFRKSFEEGEPGQYLLDILMRLFRFVVAFWSLALPRAYLNINQGLDTWRLIVSLISLGIIGALFWWTVASIRQLTRAHADIDAAELERAEEYDPYAKPFGEV